MKKNKDREEKLTIYEYEQKYSSKTNAKRAAVIFDLVVAVLGVFVFTCLFMLFKDAYDFNVYLGYGTGAVGVLLYIFLFIVPIVKIKKMRRFEVDVTALTARKAQRHNEKVRRELADEIIECYVSTEGSSSWYSSESVKTLVEARKGGDKKSLKDALDVIYSKDVKRAASGIIKRSALKAGTYSAVSQKDSLDALLVTVINIQMIKDIVYLYGFRPSDVRFIKIVSNVLTNSLLAYGLGNVRVGLGNMSDVMKNIPILGGAISVIVDSSVQGLANATLTAILGRNTIKYLLKEYRLQSILDGVEITESDEEFIRTCEELKEELANEKKADKKRSKEKTGETSVVAV